MRLPQTEYTLSMHTLKGSRFSWVWYTFSVCLAIAYVTVAFNFNSLYVNDIVFLLQLPVYVAVIILHEGIHIVWKIIFGYTGKMVRVRNGSTSIITFVVDQPIKKWHFLAIVSSPFILLNIATIPFLFTPYAPYILLPMLLNNLGCHIDAKLTAVALLSNPKHVEVNNGTIRYVYT